MTDAAWQQEVDQELERMIHHGIIETQIVDGEPQYRLTPAGQRRAEERMEADTAAILRVLEMGSWLVGVDEDGGITIVCPKGSGDLPFEVAITPKEAS